MRSWQALGWAWLAILLVSGGLASLAILAVVVVAELCSTGSADAVVGTAIRWGLAGWLGAVVVAAGLDALFHARRLRRRRLE